MGGNRLAIIGIDGATWSVLRWLIREGWMPNLKRLVEWGIHGELRSLIPPVTGCAWLAIATGLNPGKTGVIDFFKNTGDFVLEPVSSADFQGRSIWDYLSVLGYKIAILDYPMLYPAYPVNGIMLCSWGANISTFPKSLADHITDIVDGYEIFVDYHLEKYNDIDLFLSDLDRVVKKKLKVSRYFMRREWDLFIDVFSFTDWLQHRMWHYIDSSHPMYPGEIEAFKYKKKFAEYWQLLDEYIGEVSETYDNILVISDHGFGPQWGVFNLAKWLLKHKFSVARRKLRRRIVEIISKVLRKTRLTKVIPQKLRKEARKHGLTIASLLYYFDVEKSKLITLEYTIPFGAVHINPRLKNAEDIIRIFTHSLNALSDELGKKLRVHIWRSRDIYQGDKVDLLPDLIFTINDWSCVIVKDPEKNFIYMDSPYSPRHTGSHRVRGIFVAYGESFKKQLHISRISVLDIAPTVLYIFNAPIPFEIDGKVLKEITVYENTREPRYVPTIYYRIKRSKRTLQKTLQQE